MFNVILGICTDDSRNLNKGITGTQTFPCVLKDKTDVMNPVLIIECDLTSVTCYNYAQIPAMGRYYFIKNIRSVTNNICEIEMHVDVLQTYSQSILNLSGTLDRSETLYDYYLKDDHKPFKTIDVVKTMKFTGGSHTDNMSLILTTSYSVQT